MQASSNNRLLLVSVLVVLISSLLTSLIQSSGGRVQVRDIKIPTQNGQWLVADLFKPRSATSGNPAPLVVVVPGFQRSKESLSNISLELARRGVVVIAIEASKVSRTDRLAIVCLPENLLASAPCLCKKSRPESGNT